MTMPRVSSAGGLWLEPPAPVGTAGSVLSPGYLVDDPSTPGNVMFSATGPATAEFVASGTGGSYEIRYLGEVPADVPRATIMVNGDGTFLVF
jgi:hypothetical protein